MARKGDTPTADAPTRTLVLGIDASGTVVQCGQNAHGVLGRAPEEVLSLKLSDLVADPGGQLDTLLDAVGSEQERTAMLQVMRTGDPVGNDESVEVRTETAIDAIVTVQPMLAAEDKLAGLVHIRVALPSSERFLDPGMMRRALLDDPLTRFGASLDLDQVARGLMDVLVPHFCNAAALVVLESLVAADEVHGEATDGSAALRRLAVATDDGDPLWSSTFPTGEVLVYPQGTPYVQCLDTAAPVLLPLIDVKAAAKIAKSWRRNPVKRLLTDASMVVLPLIARGTLLGLIVSTRAPGFRRFDPYDVEIGMEFAARAAIVIDNARRFSRERATALALQRSLLPHRLSAPTSVEVKHRYLPGSKLIEVGGDWYDSIALPGARVALIVGDVAGHGVRAAVTMGRLRTALHTLAGLEIPPAEALQVMHELMIELGEQEPHFATCVYAVYDATTGTCEIASAGHLPPLLVQPDGTSELLEVPPAPPLGVEGGGTIESREFTIPDGSLFLLYTDGLVENRGRDIDDGLAALRGLFDAEAANTPMADLAKATLDSVYSDEHRDDIAVLLARLRRLPKEQYVSWQLPSEPAAVRRARGLVSSALEEWDLAELSYTTELLASELITNALRYAKDETSSAPIELRLLYERTLICEVHDHSAALPRLRHATDDEESGRGLQVVSRLSHRWGTRRTATGKVVWCEQAVPGFDPDATIRSASWPGEDLHRV
ncbi:MAG TPA: SpoIIE family protein phosphatase [Streptosporangiaceae bacterium]|jgi:serine phosphatase RsbU (regulator of sigma subunit)/anti-sigma regulatory factor (Ser/Thr protein kinase)